MGTYVCLKNHKTGVDILDGDGWYEGKWREFLNLDMSEIDAFSYGEMPESSFDDDNRSWRPKNIDNFKEFLLKNLDGYEDRIIGMCYQLNKNKNVSIWYSY